MGRSLVPPGLPTGFRHPKCYAAIDANCCSTLTREHFISAALLRQVELNGTAKIAGLSWQAPDTFNIVPIDGLASRVLCERHNCALSPLDACMDAFSLSIRKFDHGFRDASVTGIEESIHSGSDIEHWMLKCLIGGVASGNLRNANLKPGCTDLLLDRRHWPEAWGLYWRAEPSSRVYHSHSLAIETVLHPTNRVILLATFTIRGLPLALCLGKPVDKNAFGIWRPPAIVFRGPSQEKRLILQWDGKHATDAIFLDRAGTYDGPPPNWKHWEREG
jgi:hypothetical protein